MSTAKAPAAPSDRICEKHSTINVCKTLHPAGTIRWINVEMKFRTTSHDVISITFQRCSNVRCPLDSYVPSPDSSYTLYSSERPKCKESGSTEL